MPASRYESYRDSCYDGWRTIRGVVRSLRFYYGGKPRRAAMERLYGQFVRRDDLVFDIGAHVGDRVAEIGRAHV